MSVTIDKESGRSYRRLDKKLNKKEEEGDKGRGRGRAVVTYCQKIYIKNPFIIKCFLMISHQGLQFGSYFTIDDYFQHYLSEYVLFKRKDDTKDFSYTNIQFS